MAKDLPAQLCFELDQIDKLLDSYSELIDGVLEKIPDLTELTALASVVHSFYNGIENIFTQIAKRKDQNFPRGLAWHKELLASMTKTTDARNVVISEKVANKLLDYLAFRHFYRHSYSFTLDWGELKKLVIELKLIWAEVKGEIIVFMGTIISK